jgi:hypothetical protein
MAIIHNNRVKALISSTYSAEALENISQMLCEGGTFDFTSLPNGLFSASLSEEAGQSGYANVWIRDNVYIAMSYFLIGRHDVAGRVATSLMKYFTKHRVRLEKMITGVSDPADFMSRPHVRFDGQYLDELPEAWNHAQNDALGYFLWFYCKMALHQVVCLGSDELYLLSLFPSYFEAIKFWKDQDSGHWEEDPKLEASSVGVVVAGLKELYALYTSSIICINNNPLSPDTDLMLLVDELIKKGVKALVEILPNECVQPPPLLRQYDAALIFLIYPLQVVDTDMASLILSRIKDKLEGDYGIRRYIGDSFWCRDYLDLPPTIRTSKSTDRDAWLLSHDRKVRFGEEAQWCIFDPFISIIYGERYQKTGSIVALEQQVRYFNRSLGQITSADCVTDGVAIPELKCPELYFLSNGEFVPNTSTPLLWAQAGLQLALFQMKLSLAKA